MLEIWIEEAKVNAPKLNRQQLESLYMSALRVGLSFEKERMNYLIELMRNTMI